MNLKTPAGGRGGKPAAPAPGRDAARPPPGQGRGAEPEKSGYGRADFRQNFVRFRLYRRRSLQVNLRFEAFFKIY